MLLKFVLISVGTLVTSVSATFSFTRYDGYFRNLAVTLPDPTRLSTLSYWFNELPQTEEDAVQQRWKPSGGNCSDYGNHFVGNRYLPPSEPSIALLFDKRGTLAGFQAIYDVQNLALGSNHSDCNTWKRYLNNYDYLKQPMINIETIDERPKFVLTAYFYTPTKICSSIRDPLLVKERGFGKSLYFQNGPTPEDLITAPKRRSEAAAINWNNDRCLPLNGYHNFMNSSHWDEHNCHDFLPAWLLYDEDGALSGFGFSLPGCDPSPRFQHPPGIIAQYVTGSSCARRVGDTVKFSNINVYLVPVKDTLDDCIADIFGIRFRIEQICNFARAVTDFCQLIFY